MELLTRPIRAAVPTFEPISLPEAKRQLGIGSDTTHMDDDISRLIQSSRETFEHDANVVCATGTYSWKLTNWPPCDILELPSLRPVSSVTSIAYIATDGTSTTWGSGSYVFESSAVVPSIRLAYLESWPVLRGDPNGITVTFVAGYSSAQLVPQMWKRAMLMLIARDFEDREGLEARNMTGAYEALVRRVERSTYP